MSAEHIVFVRHGQTDHNVAHRVQGQIDIPLNDTGRAQARATGRWLGRELKDRDVVIVSSDLSRASDTAKALAAECGVEIVFDARVRERGFGDFEGLSGSELAEQFPDAYETWRSGGTPDGIGIEEKLDVGRRVADAALEHASKASPNSTVVVVSHGSSITQGLRRLLGIEDTALPVFRGLDNCCWAEIEAGNFRGNPGWRLRAHNVSPR